MRKLISLLATLLLSLHLVSCTSNDSKDDGSTGDEAVAESTEGTDGDLENLDAPAGDSSVAASDNANEGFLDEQLPEDALGESTSTASNEAAPAPDTSSDLNLDDSTTSSTTAAADAPATTSDSTSTESTPPPPVEEPAASTSSADPMAALDTGTPSPAIEDSSSSSLTAMGSTEEKSAEPPAETKPKVTASLKKVEASPMTRSKVLLNAVYVARPGDTYKKISEMIYGNTSKQKELKKVNSSISKPRPGDKIYYNSPIRPTDDTKMLTFYEDAGMVPEVYVAQEGDNLKKVSKNLLGYDNAWKEVWAMNSVESKDTLAAGTELRYWKSAPAPVAPPPTEMPTAPSTEIAAQTPPPTEQTAMPDLPPPPPANELPPPTMAANEMPQTPPSEMAPPPPPPANELPPPPPPEAVNPPPPPPVAKKTPTMGLEEGMDQDMMMALGAAGIVAAGLALMIIIRKRRQNRDMATAFNDTQVGT